MSLLNIVSTYRLFSQQSGAWQALKHWRSHHDILSFALHHVAFYWRVLKWNTHTVQDETYRISYITVTRPASLDSITVTERV